jgi:hypothetical protein
MGFFIVPLLISFFIAFFIAFMIARILMGPSRQFNTRDRQREYWRSLPPPREQLPGSPTCPRCRSEMVHGYLLDRTLGGFGMGTWLEGQPVYLGLFGDVLRPRLERSIPIVSYRCTGCGYLELYARPELVEELDRGKPVGQPEL